MAISYRSISASSGSGITSTAYRAPATLESGDLILWFCVNKYAPAAPTTPTGHTLVMQVEGGDGTPGLDTGDVVAGWYSKVSDGTEDATTESISVSGGNSVTSRSVAFARDAGTGWSVAATSAEQTVAANTWTLATGNIDVAAGDMLVIGVAKNSDRDLTHSYAISASGITFGTVTSAHTPVGTTNGDDVAYHIAYVPVTAGSGTVPLSITLTMSGSAGSTAGVVTVLRLRESGAGSTPVGFDGTVQTLIGKPGVAFSQSLSSYFTGSLTPFSYAVQAGALPAGLSLNSSTGEISGTPTGSGTSTGIVIRATDTEANTADTNAFAIGLEANPSTDVGYYAVASSGNASYAHTTASHSFFHDGSWWTMLRAGASNWNLYEESGNTPTTPGDTVDWVATPHLSAVHTSPHCTVAADGARNKAYVLGFGSGQTTINFRVLTYSGGSWSVTESFNVAGTGGVGVGTGTTFANQSKLSLGIDPNGVPYVFAGNPGSGATPANGCHLAWPNNPASLGGTWSFHTIDSGGATEGDASGRFAGIISQGGTDYIVVCYTDDTAEKVRLAYHAVETTLSNYTSGWTIVDLETTLSVDNHVWAGVMNHGGEQVVVTAVKDGDGAGAGQLQLITSQLGPGMTWTHKRHRITNGIADAVPVQESPSRPSCVLDSTNGEVWVFYHSKDSHPYGWIGYKRALLADLLAASSTTAVFDTTAPRNSVVAIYDASLDATWNAKTPAHPVTSAMGYFPVTAAVAASSAAGDSVWWSAYDVAGDPETTAGGILPTATVVAPTGAADVSATSAGSAAALNLTPPSAAATASVETGGTISPVSLTAPTGTSSTFVEVTASGSLAPLSLSAPVGSAAVISSVTGAFAQISLTAPTGAAGTFEDVLASGGVAAASLSPPTASATTAATATGLLGALSLTAPTGTSSTAAETSATGAVAPLSLVAPLGSAAVTTSVTGALDPLSFTAPSGTADALAATSATGSLAEVSLAPPDGAATTVTLASGVIASVSLAAPNGTADSFVLVTADGSIAPLLLAAPTGSAGVDVVGQGAIGGILLAAPRGRGFDPAEEGRAGPGVSVRTSELLVRTRTSGLAVRTRTALDGYRTRTT